MRTAILERCTRDSEFAVEDYDPRLSRRVSDGYIAIPRLANDMIYSDPGSRSEDPDFLS
jgi:hypothetical protein